MSRGVMATLFRSPKRIFFERDTPSCNLRVSIYIGIFSLTPTFITVYVRYRPRCCHRGLRGANGRARGKGGRRGKKKKNASICVIRGKRKGERGRFTPRRFADKMNFYSCEWGFDTRGSWLSALFRYTLRDIKYVSQRKERELRRETMKTYAKKV